MSYSIDNRRWVWKILHLLPVIVFISTMFYLRDNQPEVPMLRIGQKVRQIDAYNKAASTHPNIPNGSDTIDDQGYNIVRHNIPCRPRDHIVFIKTHKTGSSTLAGILDRFALKYHLTKVPPVNKSSIFHLIELFDRVHVAPTNEHAPGWSAADGFHVLTDHARYNRAEMDAVVHNATYITILREPTAQFESAFSYFGLCRYMDKDNKYNKNNKNTAFEVLVTDIQNHTHYIAGRMPKFAYALDNWQMFDLGLQPDQFSNASAVKAKIKQLDEEMGLVMITEYFDESLVLLHKLLCWDLKDVVYYSRFVRNSKLSMSEETKERIRNWNKLDVMLYNHFNKTLWRKIAEYGPSFAQDLAALREINKNVTFKSQFQHPKVGYLIRAHMVKRGIIKGK